jgi:putative FmdB family regulatory protein
MPTYLYACKTCEHNFEAQQSIHDEALKVCPECGGELKKIFGQVGVAFKGSGFYRTDNAAPKSD